MEFNAQRRKNLIISGYIRKIEKKLNIIIPNDIKKVLNLLYCCYYDSWNKEFSNKLLK